MIQALGFLNFLTLDNYTIKGSDLDLFQKYVTEASKQAVLMGRSPGVLIGGKITHVAGLNFKVEKSAYLFDSGQVVVTDELPFSLPAADLVNPRIDRIVIQYSAVNGTVVKNNKNEDRTLDKTHTGAVVVLDGIPAAVPVAKAKTVGTISIGIIPLAAGQAVSSQAEVNQLMDTSFEQSATYLGSSQGQLRYNRDSLCPEISADSGVSWEQLGKVVSNKLSATILNNQVAATAIDKAILDLSKAEDFRLYISIKRKTDTNFVKCNGHLFCSYNENTAQWEITPMFNGVEVGVDFSLVQIGVSTQYQLKYVSDNLVGANYQGSMKFSITSL